MQTFLPAFEMLVEDGELRGVMCGYNSVNGVPLCANKLIAEQLRGRMGFDGIVISDCGAIGMMTGNHHWKHTNGTPYTGVEATAAAMAAGTDLNCGRSYRDQLPTAYQQGMVALEQLQAAVGRIVFGYLELGLMEDTATAAADPRRQIPMSVVDSTPHRALAKQAAQEGVVVLKNSDALPLGAAGMASLLQARASMARSAPIKLAVLGPNANRTSTLTSNYAGCKDKAGGPILASCTFVNPLQGIEAAAKASAAFDDVVTFAQGVDIDTQDTAGMAAAVTAAKQADVAIFIGGLITCQESGDQCQEAEARDRSTPTSKGAGRDYGIHLPGKQIEMLQMLANSTTTEIILVVMSGSAVAVPWVRHEKRSGPFACDHHPAIAMARQFHAS